MTPRLFSFLILGASLALAGGREPLMTKKGKLLLEDSFASFQSTARGGGGWTVNKGEWKIADGVLLGVEKKEDKHAAVIRRDLAFHNAIFEFSFQFTGGRALHLSLNGAKGHISRVTITPTSITVRRDADKSKAGDKGEALHTRTVNLRHGEWYTMLVEVLGDKMLASMDEQNAALGESPGLNLDKTNIGFPVAGEGVKLRGLRVWEALPGKPYGRRVSSR
jgi:hypothetical protein